MLKVKVKISKILMRYVGKRITTSKGNWIYVTFAMIQAAESLNWEGYLYSKGNGWWQLSDARGNVCQTYWPDTILRRE